MYRRVLTALPQEPQFPQDLNGLGYFINDKDQVESIDRPGEEFKYKVSKNARYNELRKEALNGCLRKIVLERITGIGLSIVRLPFGVKENEPHVPILVSPNLREKNRVMIIFNGREQDLGVWAYRRLGSGGSSIDAGSAVNFVKHLSSYHTSEEDAPGVIIANLGQLLWHRKGKRAITFATWQDMPRKSAVSDMYRIDEKKNTIPGNEDSQAHISYIFNKVLKELVGDKAVLNILAVSPAFDLLDFLDENWEEWNGRIESMALTQPFHRVQQFQNPNFKTFLLKRARAYIVSDEPEGELQYEPNYGCAVYSSGEKDWAECIIPTAHKLILDFFHEVATDPNFTNPETIIIEDDNAQEQRYEEPADGEAALADDIRFWDDLTAEEKRKWHAGERL